VATCRDEIEILPDLINLRIFSNVIYFTGRALAKEDSIDSLTSRAPSYAKRVQVSGPKLQHTACMPPTAAAGADHDCQVIHLICVPRSLQWVNANKAAIVDAVKAKMLAKTTA
jgi:hypothetical protein